MVVELHLLYYGIMKSVNNSNIIICKTVIKMHIKCSKNVLKKTKNSKNRPFLRNRLAKTQISYGA